MSGDVEAAREALRSMPIGRWASDFGPALDDFEAAVRAEAGAAALDEARAAALALPPSLTARDEIAAAIDALKGKRLFDATPAEPTYTVVERIDKGSDGNPPRAATAAEEERR